MQRRRATGAAGATLALALFSPEAAAYPQWNLSLSPGFGRTLAPPEAREWLLSLGARADVLFGARSPYAVRLGPYASLRSDDFDDLGLSLGLSLALPVSHTFPLVLSAGGAVELLEGPARVGGLARVWWGARSINYHSTYGMSVGLWAEGRWFPGDGRGDVLFGLDLDLRFLTLPAVMLYEWARR